MSPERTGHQDQHRSGPNRSDPNRDQRIDFDSLRDSLDADSPQVEGELEALWTQLGDIPGEAADPELSSAFFDRFAPAVARERRVEPAGLGRGLRALAVAAAVILAFALGSGWSSQRASRGIPDDASAVAGGASDSRLDAAESRLSRLETELLQMRFAVTAALRDGRSASTRLSAVAASQAWVVPGDPVLEALLHAAANDGNVGVRLAAIDALDRAEGERLKARVAESLSSEDSPLVQMALLDRVTGAPPATVEPILRAFLERGDLVSEVRQRARDLLSDDPSKEL